MTQQSCMTQLKAMLSEGMSFFQRPLIVYQCDIYRQLAVVSDNISTVVTFWRCMASRLTALCRLIFHTSRPILVLQYRRTASVTSCSTGTLKCVYGCTALIGRILEIHQTHWTQTHETHFTTALTCLLNHSTAVWLNTSPASPASPSPLSTSPAGDVCKYYIGPSVACLSVLSSAVAAAIATQRRADRQWRVYDCPTAARSRQVSGHVVLDAQSVCASADRWSIHTL